jgi:hypothetical protein
MGMLPDFNVPNLSVPDPDVTQPSIDFEEATPYGELSEMSRERLVRLYNEKAGNGSPGAIMRMHLILSELHRRDAEDREKEMINNNWRMLWLTIFIAVLTLTNVGVAVLQALEVL